MQHWLQQVYLTGDSPSAVLGHDSKRWAGPPLCDNREELKVIARVLLFTESVQEHHICAHPSDNESMLDHSKPGTWAGLLLLLHLLHLHAWAARAAPPSDSFVNGGCNSSTGVIQSHARASGLRVLDSGESGSLWGRYSLSGQVHAFRTPSDSFLKVWVASRSL